MAMAGVTKKDIFDTLTEFYGKVIEPEFRAIRTKLDEHDQKFGDIAKHFDQIYQRFERLETEYFAINAAIDRIEKRLDRMEPRLERVEGGLEGGEGQLGRVNEKLDKEISIRESIEKEIKDLKERVSVLQGRIQDLEKRLKTFS